MTRTCFAALIALCGLVSAAPAQVYTTYYAPSYSAYSHAPAYSGYGYSTGYGPLGLVDWSRWSGSSPYRTSYYSSPYWSGSSAPAYTAGYGPSYSTGYSTSFYAPSSYAAYSPSFAAYSPMLASADTCCMVPTSPCCPTSCCGTGLACAGGNCPGGNCGMNYGPADMTPTPDPASSGSSGSRRYESESDPGADRPRDPNEEEDGFRRSSPTDNYDGNPRGADYGPRRPIEQRNGSDLPKAPTEIPDADLPDDGFEPLPSDDLDKRLDAPEADPAADRSLLDLDSKLTKAPSLIRQRHSMHARFGSPKLARAKVDPSQLPASVDLRIVRK